MAFNNSNRSLASQRFINSINAMALNNNNHSLASQRSINSTNAIVIQEDDWWTNLLQGTIGLLSFAGIVNAVYIGRALYEKFRDKYKKCAEIFEKMLLKKEYMVDDGGRSVSLRPEHIQVAISMINQLDCIIPRGYFSKEFMEKLRAKFGEHFDRRLQRLLKIIRDLGMIDGCSPEIILALLKATAGSWVSKRDWEKLADRLKLEGLDAMLADIALLGGAVWDATTQRCTETCTAAALATLYVRSKFPDLALKYVDEISTYLAAIIALIIAIEILPYVAGSAAAVELTAQLVAARAALAGVLRSAGVLPAGMDEGSYMDNLIDELKEVGCGTPTDDATDEENSTDEDTTPPDGNPPGGGTPPGGGALPAGGMPPANYKPNSTTPTTNSNASRQIFNRKLR